MTGVRCRFAVAALLAFAAWGLVAADFCTADVSATLAARTHLRLIGAPAAAGSVSGTGDVNGDGRPDVLVGAPDADNNGRRDSGSVYVVFGRPTPGTIDLRQLGTGGFRIDGAARALPIALPGEGADGDLGRGAGAAVAGAGDLNGDGLADIAVGAPASSASLRLFSGSVYVVFGKRSSDPVDLDALGENGYRIDGDRVGDNLGGGLAGAGDVNGDGRGDLVIANGSSSAYVVFGKATVGPIDTRTLAAQGYAIVAASREVEGLSVAGAGDVNADGRADVLVGAPSADVPGRPGAGAAFVLFGQSSTDTISLAALGQRGYRIKGATPNENLGAQVAGAGDVNGDGRPDAVVGDAVADEPSFDAPGRAYVVFGQPGAGTIDLHGLGKSGFRIDGTVKGGEFGTSIAGVGDVNGDGRSDVAVGAPKLARGCRIETGSVYVLFGRAQGGVTRLDRLGTAGYRLDGTGQFEDAGSGIAGAGDVTGDGRPDLIVSSFGAGHGFDRPSSASVVSGLSPVARREPGPRRCLRIRVLTHSLSSVLRTGRLRVRITALATGLAVDQVDVRATLLRSGTRTDRAIPVAGAMANFERHRTRTIILRLNARGRRQLRGKRRARLRITAETLRLSSSRDGLALATLRRRRLAGSRSHTAQLNGGAAPKPER